MAGRLVLFPSRSMPHRVMPSHRERMCYTAWLGHTRGAGVGKQLQGGDAKWDAAVAGLQRGEGDGEEALFRAAAHPALWKHVCKVRISAA